MIRLRHCGSHITRIPTFDAAPSPRKGKAPPAPSAPAAPPAVAVLPQKVWGRPKVKQNGVLVRRGSRLMTTDEVDAENRSRHATLAHNRAGAAMRDVIKRLNIRNKELWSRTRDRLDQE